VFNFGKGMGSVEAHWDEKSNVSMCKSGSFRVWKASGFPWPFVSCKLPGKQFLYWFVLVRVSWGWRNDNKLSKLLSSHAVNCQPFSSFYVSCNLLASVAYYEIMYTLFPCLRNPTAAPFGFWDTETKSMENRTTICVFVGGGAGWAAC